MEEKLMKKIKFLPLILALFLFGCTERGGIYTDIQPMDFVVIEEEAVALADSPAPETALLAAEASGTAVKQNASAVIDYSNADDGYVMVQYTAKTDKRLKAQVKGPAVTYTYNLTPGEWAVFPIAEGDGSYTVTMYINASGTKYAAVISETIPVKLNSEFMPFLYPNQYVNYADAPNTVAKAAELTKNCAGTLENVMVVYDYVVKTLTYDQEKAAAVRSGYLPVLDEVLEKKTGICFDYAALMTGMLRSRGIPCKLVVGYAGSAYHAWISV